MKRVGRTTRTMVLSETRPRAGLTLLRVLRGGLGLSECLGVTGAGRNVHDETVPRTVVRESGAAARETSPKPGLEAPGYVTRIVSFVGS